MGGEGKASVASPRDRGVRRWTLRGVVDTVKREPQSRVSLSAPHPLCSLQPGQNRHSSAGRQWQGVGLGVEVILFRGAAEGALPPPTPTTTGHTPHVFWLVQSEVDLIDLSSGDGIRGYEEADSCKSRGVTACGYRYPIPQELARPTSFPLSGDRGVSRTAILSHHPHRHDSESGRLQEHLRQPS